MNERYKNSFTTRVKEVLDENSVNLDAEIQKQLKQARLRAIASLEMPERVQQGPAWFSWMPASAMLAGLLGVVIYMDQVQSPLPAIYQDSLQQTAAENMELLDNLEFAAWLVLQEGA